MRKVASPTGLSPTEEYLLSVARGRPGLLPTLLRGLMVVLAYVYCAGLELYLLPYHLGIRQRKRLPCRVVSIGNLTTGGTGKTPLTQTLCRRLQAQGKKVVVLNRGYGGANEYGCAVVSDGERVLLTAQEAGDEAYLLAKTLPGVPVIVGKDRRVTGERACHEFAPDLLLLDDGMQFWQLHRDLDIALLNACTPFDNGWTFPRGLLREPPSHLRRARAVVLTNVGQAGSEQVERVRTQVQRFAPQSTLFIADLVARAELPEFGSLQGRRIATLCAIGNPASFERLLESLGAVLVARFSFRDHHTLSDAEWEQVVQEAQEAQAEALLTTEKDAVKMPPRSSPLPLFALPVSMQVEEEDTLLRLVLPD